MISSPPPSQQTVLLVQHDEALREELKSLLRGNGYEVVEAAGVEAARGVLKERDVQLIIADLGSARAPIGRPAPEPDLSAWATISETPTPFVLIAECGDVARIFESYASGAVDLLTKPFQPSDAILAVDRILRPQADRQFGRPLLDPGFARLSIEMIVQDQLMRADIYIRLSPSKYVRVARQGGTLDRERTDRYQRLGVVSLFVKRIDLQQPGFEEIGPKTA